MVMVVAFLNSRMANPVCPDIMSQNEGMLDADREDLQANLGFMVAHKQEWLESEKRRNK